MSTGAIIATLAGILASLIQALSLFLLKQIFTELKDMRETFRDYVTKEVCEAQMTSAHYRIKNLEQGGGHSAGLLLAGAALLLLFGAGCGHNVVSYGDGIQLSTTINPEAGEFGVAFRYGKILTVCVRENAEVEMQGAGSGSAGTEGKTSGAESTGSVKVKIGQQVTGYTVDLAKAKQAQAQPAGK